MSRMYPARRPDKVAAPDTFPSTGPQNGQPFGSGALLWLIHTALSTGPQNTPTRNPLSGATATTAVTPNSLAGRTLASHFRGPAEWLSDVPGSASDD